MPVQTFGLPLLALRGLAFGVHLYGRRVLSRTYGPSTCLAAAAEIHKKRLDSPSLSLLLCRFRPRFYAHLQLWPTLVRTLRFPTDVIRIVSLRTVEVRQHTMRIQSMPTGKAVILLVKGTCSLHRQMTPPSPTDFPRRSNAENARTQSRLGVAPRLISSGNSV